MQISVIVSAFFKLYKLLILLRVILSWTHPNHYNATITKVYKFTDPLIMPIRERMPLIQGIDFSPWVAIIIVDLLERVSFNILNI